MKKNKVLMLVTALVYLFLIGPLLVIAAASFSDTNYLKFPGEGFTLRWYAQVLSVGSFGRAAQLSLFIALAGTGIALALGLPAAYAHIAGAVRLGSAPPAPHPLVYAEIGGENFSPNRS